MDTRREFTLSIFYGKFASVKFAANRNPNDSNLIFTPKRFSIFTNWQHSDLPSFSATPRHRPRLYCVSPACCKKCL
jgi:hypothetical protein